MNPVEDTMEESNLENIPASTNAASESLPETAPAEPIPHVEEEIDLNLMFPDEKNDLNDLFPDEEMKLLLKRIQKNKKDLSNSINRLKENSPEE